MFMFQQKKEGRKHHIGGGLLYLTVSLSGRHFCKTKKKEEKMKEESRKAHPKGRKRAGQS